MWLLAALSVPSKHASLSTFLRTKHASVPSGCLRTNHAMRSSDIDRRLICVHQRHEDRVTSTCLSTRSLFFCTTYKLSGPSTHDLVAQWIRRWYSLQHRCEPKIVGSSPARVAYISICDMYVFFYMICKSLHPHSLAEWSKALASGVSPRGRGFEPLPLSMSERSS